MAPPPKIVDLVQPPAWVGLEEAESDDDVQVLVDDADEEDQVDNLAQACLWWCASSLLSSLS